MDEDAMMAGRSGDDDDDDIDAAAAARVPTGVASSQIWLESRLTAERDF